jgi:hypothetical protein
VAQYLSAAALSLKIAGAVVITAYQDILSSAFPQLGKATLLMSQDSLDWRNKPDIVNQRFCGSARSAVCDEVLWLCFST